MDDDFQDIYNINALESVSRARAVNTISFHLSNRLNIEMTSSSNVEFNLIVSEMSAV